MAGMRRRLTILDMMLLIAGLAVGLWLGLGLIRKDPNAEIEFTVLLAAAYLLGGVSLIGPPLLLWQRYHHRPRKRLGVGESFWFCQGTASWLLWPPVIVRRVGGIEGPGPMSGLCFAYGTPLMALSITITLLAGGWLRVRRRRRKPRHWTETFGLILGLLWACTGLYALSILYRADFWG